MVIITRLTALLAGALILTPGWATDPDPAALRQVLESYRQQFGMPALGASIVLDGELVAASVVGVRRSDRPNKAKQNDRFHIGSIAKSFTATLVARMVEQKVLRWDDTLLRMFPTYTMNPAYRQVSVRQLMTHLSGMPYQPRTAEKETDRHGPSLYAKRQGYVIAALKDAPEASPGTRFIYGGGQILVANYIESRRRQPFEKLLAQEVFKPLGLNSARFGDPAADNRRQGIWSHIRQGGKSRALAPDVNDDLQARSPVGRNLSMSIGDLGRFVAMHLRGARGDSDYLKPVSWQQLHSHVAPGHHAPAWAVGSGPWARGRILYHAGSNLRNFALCHIIPDEAYAICTASNIWYEGIHQQHDEITQKLAEMIHEGVIQ